MEMLRNRTVKLSVSISRSLRAHSYPKGPAAFLQFRAVTSATGSKDDQRKRLTTELKNAMKSKNTFASTVLRSVLADVYSADKNPSGPISSSQITSILRKAIARRTDSAAQFTAASRPELAEAEKREVEFLATLLPPSMSESDIDTILHKLAAEQNLMAPGIDPNRAMGMLLKVFFGQVDRALVDGQLVKQRAQAMFDSSSQQK